MKRLIIFTIVLFSFQSLLAQDYSVFSEKETSRILNHLASDNMRGRAAFSPDIDRASDFIASEFKKVGLKPLTNNSYQQTFYMSSATLRELDATIDSQKINSNNIVIVPSDSIININEMSGYEIKTLDDAQNIFAAVNALINDGENKIVLVDTSLQKIFSRLDYFNQNFFPRQGNTIFLLGTHDLSAFIIRATFTIEKKKLSNVVAVLDGKNKKNEYVIFSAHYDHLGIGKPNEKGDSIYNGANDDASGTTAVIELAKYFKQKNNNERTLIFAAFTAEEEGGFGSKYFSKQLPADSIIAMFNIEMIGTESKWGANSAYITGFDRSDMGTILQKNLQNSGFNFYPDPYLEQNLFYRSDNATLAKLGVPAHTISTSKMDGEPNYHQLSDEVNTLDLHNMTEIIKSIAISSSSIVSGKETPKRVMKEE